MVTPLRFRAYLLMSPDAVVQPAYPLSIEPSVTQFTFLMYRISLIVGLTVSVLLSYAQPYSGFLSLDGADDYAEASFAGTLLPAGQDFTIETWVRTCGSTGYIVDARDAMSGEGLAISVISSTQLRVQMQGSGGPLTAVDQIIEATLSATGWQHIALLHESATSTNTVYLSGRSLGSFTAEFSPAANFVVGRDVTGSGAYFDGYLDEMRVSNIIRYTGPFNPNGPFSPDAQTLALWHFDEEAGATELVDASGFVRSLSPRMGAGAGQVFSISGGGSVCPGASVALSASGAISYSWSPVVGLDNPTSPTPTASPDESTYYLLTAADSNSCVSLGLVHVSVRPEPVAIATTAHPMICRGATTQLFAEGGLSYLWSNGAISQNPFVSPSETSTYSVVVSDAFGCTAEASVEVVVEECSTTTGIPSNDLLFSFSAGPNPGYGDLWINLGMVEGAKVSMNIFDAMGRLVKSYAPEFIPAGAQQRQLTTGLDQGHYWLVLDTGESRHSQAFTVLR